MKGATIHNGMAIAVDKVPLLTMEEFRSELTQSVREGARISALLGEKRADGRDPRFFLVLAWDGQGMLSVASTKAVKEYSSFTPDAPQAHWFERDMAEQLGVKPIGHPWLKPIRFQPQAAGPVRCGVTDFFKMEGEEIHEVAVGPVHAGIIEPGHFRFQCHGENVYHMEISLGYQHRGVERAMVGGPGKRSVHYMETLAGDTTIGHAMSYSMIAEALSGRRVMARADAIRGIALELERAANHVGDMGALAGDIGFLPTMSYCGRIRGDILNLTAAICGNRFGRGMVRPGGVMFDIGGDLATAMIGKIKDIQGDADNAINLLWETPTVLARFEGAGPITAEICNDAGLVGVPVRACGMDRDVRKDFPFGIFRFSQVPVSTWNSGDVFARAFVRRQEITRSFAFITEMLETLPEGSVMENTLKMAPGQIAVSLVEGWRGEICHVAVTDAASRFSCYKVVDPSFHNWFGLACALRNQQISDFPLCNKSFNLSYCGHDL